MLLPLGEGDSAAAARIAAAAELPRRRVAGHRVHAAEEQVPLVPADQAKAALRQHVETVLVHAGLYLHGEQHFTYHRQPMAGDVLQGRMRVSEPMAKAGSRGRMEVTFMDTEWRDPDGTPVVTERIVSIFIPNQ